MSANQILLNAKKGLNPVAVFDFISVSEQPTKQVETLLNKTVKTFTAYKRSNTVLDSTVSEKLLKLFGLYNDGIEIFGTAKEFNEWLNESSYGLGGKIPITLLDTITGIDHVDNELKRIAFGDLA